MPLGLDTSLVLTFRLYLFHRVPGELDELRGLACLVRLGAIDLGRYHCRKCGGVALFCHSCAPQRIDVTETPCVERRYCLYCLFIRCAHPHLLNVVCCALERRVKRKAALWAPGKKI